MAESLSARYDAYRDALNGMASLAVRGDAAERASAAARRDADARMRAKADGAAAELAALRERREALAARLAGLGLVTQARSPQRPPATKDPGHLIAQLLDRAGRALGECDSELAAIERQRVRVREARAADEARRARDRDAAAGVAAARAARAAQGDRVFRVAAVTGALLSFTAGMVGPTGSGAIAAVVLAAVAGLLLRGRPTTIAVRLAPNGAASESVPVAIVVAGECGLNGLAAAAGSLVGAHLGGALLGALVIAGATTYLLLNLPRDRQGRTA